MQVNGTWTPTIVAFCCNWCSYAGADLSGTNRLSYPANVKIIRIPCSCRLNPMFILRAFLGIERERTRVEWVSAAEGAKFAKTMNEFAETITKLGENRRLEDLRCKE